MHGKLDVECGTSSGSMGFVYVLLYRLLLKIKSRVLHLQGKHLTVSHLTGQILGAHVLKEDTTILARALEDFVRRILSVV